ncbi:hypothetical protein INR49_017025 [Caranx melampygus]|nr:hypothetical protein INR49_017025 [Caranx melampygus]
MLVSTRNRCCVLMFLVAALRTGTSQVSEARPKANSIKPALLGETPTPATNRSAAVHSGITKKHNILAQSNTRTDIIFARIICVPISESVLSPHISALDEHNKLSTKEHNWRKTGKAHAKHSLKGHEGDPCLRSSDCSEGYCCARHFWTKICKPVLRLGEVCTKQRKKGSHGLEIFQRCDCAKGLSCKVWKDATSSSKSRLHMCQRI